VAKKCGGEEEKLVEEEKQSKKSKPQKEGLEDSNSGGRANAS
jgi:hypothetical protein